MITKTIKLKGKRKNRVKLDAFIISYTYFKGKLFMYPGSSYKFRRAYLDGFCALFFLNNSPYKEMLFKGESIEPTEIFKSYYEFKTLFKPRKEISRAVGLKISERMKKRYKIKKEEREKAKEELKNMIEWL